MPALFNFKSVSLGLVGGLAVLLVGHFIFAGISPAASFGVGSATAQVASAAAVVEQKVEEPPKSIVTHLPTPKPVKALYLTSWAAGTPSLRDHVIGLVDKTEANAVVIDIKDYSGRLAFEVDDEKLMASGVVEERIPNIKEFIAELHAKDIYVIGRISTFQDSFLVEHRPDLAVKRASDGKVWKDRKGVAWLDQGSKEVWDYVAKIARESHAVGFDELNFDYIRFPSDGDMNNIAYSFYDKTKKTKPEQLKEFYAYISKELDDLNIPLSADLFGMTTTNSDDLGIGQILEDALVYFDYIGPMVYPSHYPPTWNGLKKPAENPYEVIKYAMEGAIVKADAVASSTGSSQAVMRNKLRPWLQDFDLGATYTAEMVRAQMKATYDVGLDSWMLWDPANKYTPGGLLPDSEVAKVLSN